MATDTYEVIGDSLTIHQAIGEIRDPISQTVLGIQQGRGKTYLKGEVVEKSKISPVLLEALNDNDHPSHAYVVKRLRKVSKEAAENTGERLGAPFAGYDEMSEADVVRAMSNLPSATIALIKKYEARHDNRDAIVDYNVGFGESPLARQTGAVSSKRREADDTKTVSRIRSRETPPPANQVVEPGEGITGTGEKAIPPGTAAAEAEAESDGEGGRKKAAVRRSRRARSGASGTGKGGAGS